MMITRECDYALRIIRNLNTDTVATIAAISERESITMAIGYKVARKLEKGGLVQSVRGNSGGYKLRKGLDQITILDVYKVIEPDGRINECLKRGKSCPLNRNEAPCKMHHELCRIQKVLFDEMNRKSIQQVLEADI